VPSPDVAGLLTPTSPRQQRAERQAKVFVRWVNYHLRERELALDGVLSTSHEQAQMHVLFFQHLVEILTRHAFCATDICIADGLHLYAIVRF